MDLTDLEALAKAVQDPCADGWVTVNGRAETHHNVILDLIRRVREAERGKESFCVAEERERRGAMHRRAQQAESRATKAERANATLQARLDGAIAKLASERRSIPHARATFAPRLRTGMLVQHYDAANATRLGRVTGFTAPCYVVVQTIPGGAEILLHHEQVMEAVCHEFGDHGPCVVCDEPERPADGPCPCGAWHRPDEGHAAPGEGGRMMDAAAFVSEVLTAPPVPAPQWVRDAVRGSARPDSDDVRTALETAEHERDEARERADRDANWHFLEEAARRLGVDVDGLKPSHVFRAITALLADRDAWRAKAEARPAITREDALELFNMITEDDSDRTPPDWVDRCITALGDFVAPLVDAQVAALRDHARKAGKDGG